PDPAGVAVRAVGPSAAAACQPAIPAPAAPPTVSRLAPARNLRRSTGALTRSGSNDGSNDGPVGRPAWLASSGASPVPAVLLELLPRKSHIPASQGRATD